MQAELQTALFHAFDTLNLQQTKSFNVPPVTLQASARWRPAVLKAQSRGLRHLFVMVDSFLHQAGMTAGLERSLAMKGCYDSLALSRRRTLRHRCLRRRRPAAGRALRSVVAFGGGSVLDAAKAVALLVANPEQTLGR